MNRRQTPRSDYNAMTDDEFMDAQYPLHLRLRFDCMPVLDDAGGHAYAARCQAR
ncbi:hypothetical protein THAOC_08327, partial [Thalassiosira oceanica]